MFVCLFSIVFENFTLYEIYTKKTNSKITNIKFITFKKELINCNISKDPYKKKL